MPTNATNNVHDIAFFGPSGNPAVDAITFGFKYAPEEDGSYQATYSFAADGAVFNDEYLVEGVDLTDGFFPVTDGVAAQFRDAADFVGRVSGLQLEEVPDEGDNFGEIRLAATTGLPDRLGAGTFGDAESFGLNRTGDIWFSDRAFGDDFHGLDRVVIHELGHALGLAHPGEGLGDVANMPAGVNGDEYTIMDTNFASAFFPDATWSDISPSSFMYVDILALQRMYGVNTQATAGDDTYRFDLQEDNYMTLYDVGGKNRIEITGTTGSVAGDSVHVNLMAPEDIYGGRFINVGTTVTYYNDNDEAVGSRDETVYLAPETVIEQVVAAGGNDVLVGNEFANLLSGGAGNDVISGDAGNDILVGGAGDDIMAGGTGNDRIWAGQGDMGADIISGDDGNDAIGGGGGNDVLSGGSGEDTLYGGAGDDTLVAHGWNDGVATIAETSDNVIWAGEGNDAAVGANGNDVIHGGAGNDIVKGAGGNDTLFGGAGTDNLTGGEGDDILYGGSGADTFVFEAGDGDDVIKDFVVSEDDLDISSTATNFTNLASVQAAASEATVGSESGLLIDTGAGDSIFLVGLNLSSLADMDFTF